MCGRFTLTVKAEDMLTAFDVKSSDLPDYKPRYNIAPGQNIPVVKNTHGENSLSYMRWGLIPSWSKEMKIGYRLINARAETIDIKAAFRSAFKHRRCIIPADGFYEWTEVNGKKQPMRITLPDSSLFAFAGIWEAWTSPEGNLISSCSIITTSANEHVQ